MDKKNSFDNNSSVNANILVVDDEQVMRDLLDVYIREMNFTVIKAHDGIEALEAIEKNKPDIIITDLIMPRMNGIELIKKLKEKTSTVLLPIVVITALTEREIALEAFELGVEEFIRKPIDRMILEARLKSIYKTRNLHNELMNSRIECEKEKLFSELIMTIFHYMRNTLQPLAIANNRYNRSPTADNIKLLVETSSSSVDKLYAILDTLHEYKEKELIDIKSYYQGINMLDLEKEIHKKLAKLYNK